MRPTPIPLTVVAGFLGAGKTSLIRELLRAPELAGSLVITEDGDAARFEHPLVETLRDGPQLRAATCLCCGIRGDVVGTLEDLLRRRDNGRMAPFPRVILETAGTADPASALQAVLGHPYLRLRYRLQGLVTLVDARSGARALDEHQIAGKQVAAADRIVLAGSDLVPPPDAKRLRARLRTLNRSAPIATTAEALGEPLGLLDCGIRPDGSGIGRWLRAEPVDADAADAADAGIRTLVLHRPAPLPRAALDRFLADLLKVHGSDLLRLKGLVAVEDTDRPLAVEAVQHVLHPPRELPAWPGDDRASRMLVIIRNIDPAAVEALWVRSQPT